MRGVEEGHQALGDGRAPGPIRTLYGLRAHPVSMALRSADRRRSGIGPRKVYDARSAVAAPRALRPARRHTVVAYDVPAPLPAHIFRVLAPTAPAAACPFTNELTSGGSAT